MTEFRDLREASDEKSQCLIFLTVILTWIGNKDKPEECKHIKVFDGYLDNTPASNLGYLAPPPPPGQFFMGAKLFIGTP